MSLRRLTTRCRDGDNPYVTYQIGRLCVHRWDDGAIHFHWGYNPFKHYWRFRVPKP